MKIDSQRWGNREIGKAGGVASGWLEEGGMSCSCRGATVLWLRTISICCCVTFDAMESNHGEWMAMIWMAKRLTSI